MKNNKFGVSIIGFLAGVTIVWILVFKVMQGWFGLNLDVFTAILSLVISVLIVYIVLRYFLKNNNRYL